MQVNRQVRTIHAVRVTAFLWCFAVVAMHAWERGFGTAVWIAAALHFLVYPHLALLRAKHSREPTAHRDPEPLRRRRSARRVDRGARFPTWIAYAFIFGPALNGMVNRGLQGFGMSLACTVAGACWPDVMVLGYKVAPTTSHLVTLLCFRRARSPTARPWATWCSAQTQRLAEARDALRASEDPLPPDRRARGRPRRRWSTATGAGSTRAPRTRACFREEDLAVGRDAFRNLHEDDAVPRARRAAVVVRSGESARLRVRLHTIAGDVRRFETSTRRGVQVTGAAGRITAGKDHRRGDVVSRTSPTCATARSSSKSRRTPSSA